MFSLFNIVWVITISSLICVFRKLLQRFNKNESENKKAFSQIRVEASFLNTPSDTQCTSKINGNYIHLVGYLVSLT